MLTWEHGLVYTSYKMPSTAMLMNEWMNEWEWMISAEHGWETQELISTRLEVTGANVLFPVAAVTKCHEPGGSKQENGSSHSSGEPEVQDQGVSGAREVVDLPKSWSTEQTWSINLTGAKFRLSGSQSQVSHNPGLILSTILPVSARKCLKDTSNSAKCSPHFEETSTPCKCLFLVLHVIQMTNSTSASPTKLSPSLNLLWTDLTAHHCKLYSPEFLRVSNQTDSSYFRQKRDVWKGINS